MTTRNITPCTDNEGNLGTSTLTWQNGRFYNLYCKASPWVDVRAYGAVGDGATDDSSAIQAAINAAGASGKIYLPKSLSYYKAQNLAPILGQTFKGDWLGSVISYSGGNNPIFTLTQGNITFKDLEITHPSPGGTDAGCIKATGPMNSVRIDGCWLADAYYGYKQVGGGEVTIIGSTLETLSAGGIYLLGAYEIRIIGNYIGNGNGVGIQTGLNGSTKCHDLTFVGNTFCGNYNEAVALSSADGVAITGNTFDSNSLAIDSAKPSISLYDSAKISIIGNTGNIDTIGRGCDVNYHVYFYANTLVSDVIMSGNSWPTPRIAEVYYENYVIDDSGAHTIEVPRISYNNAVPTRGTWRTGDMIMNTSPAAGGSPGWVCVTAGTPGTWKMMAVLES